MAKQYNSLDAAFNCRVKQRFRMMYVRERTYFVSPSFSNALCARCALSKCAKPFASNSISMNVVLSSNAAYWDQFSGRVRFSSFREEDRKRERDRKEKRRQYSIPTLSARCTQSQIRSSIREESSSLKTFFFSFRDDFSGYVVQDGHRR